MHGTQLLELVDVERRDEVRKLYQTYLGAAGDAPDETLDAFAQALHERGFLTAEGLKDYLTYRELTLAPLDAAGERSRYRLTALLGSGAMGEVYAGRDATLRRAVAVKRVHADLAKDPLLLQRFFNEAQVTAQLDHPAIVPVYGLERDETGALAYAMKLVRGVTLSHYLAEAREQLEASGATDARHSLKVRIETFIPVLNALSYAHRRGVIHRDLKPDNIMVGSFGEVLVMDWGIARVLSQAEPGAGAEPSGELLPNQTNPGTSPKLTLAGTVLGTPGYMSPEQAAGRDVDARSDQYALALILQEIVTLAPAVPEDELPIMFARAVRGVRAPIAGKERIPRELRAIIDKAASPARDDRYPSVAELADDLRRFLRDESVSADPDRGLRRVQRWIGRNRGLAMALAGLIVLIALGVVALFVWQGEVALADQREEARRNEATLATLEGRVEARGDRISEELHRYEALLGGIASTAYLVLREPAPPSDAVVYSYRHGVSDPPQLPAYAKPSAIYRVPSSLRADYLASPGVDRQALRWRTDQLARMEPVMRRALLLSGGEELTRLPFDEAERLVLERGVPALWTYLHTEDGLAVGVPGTWSYADTAGADGYEHRKEEWYRVGVEARASVWTITADENGAGLTVNCVQPVRDDDGKLLAIAGLDVWLNRFIDELLALPEVGGEAFLLDQDGRVLIRASAMEAARTMTDYAPPPFQSPAAWREMAARASGHFVEGATLYLWARLGSAGLTYVIVGERATLMEHAAR